MIKFNHFNFNVLDLQRSLDFYEEALNLKPVREKKAKDGSFTLGELEYHLAFVTDVYDAWHEKHKEMGIICFENPDMGIYFIHDPDGYWIEIVPAKS